MKVEIASQAESNSSGLSPATGYSIRLETIHSCTNCMLTFRVSTNLKPAIRTSEMSNSHEFFFLVCDFYTRATGLNLSFLPTPGLNRGRASHLSFQADLLAASSSFCLLFFLLKITSYKILSFYCFCLLFF